MNNRAHVEVAERLSHGDRGVKRAFARVDHVNRAVRGFRLHAEFLHELENAFRSHRETDAGRGLSAEDLHQAIVAAAAADRRLGAETVRRPLKHRVTVVVEASDETRVHRVLDPGAFQLMLDPGEKRTGLFAKVIDQTGSVIRELLHVRILRIENTERIEVKAVLRRFVQLILMRLKVLEERLAVRGAFRRLTERIDFKLHFLNAQRLPEAGGHEDHFRVDIRTREAESLAAELIELTIAAALRTLVAEHRTEVPDTARGVVKHVVLDRRADNARGVLRTQRQPLTVQGVFEGIHFLLHDVSRFTDTVREEVRRLKHRAVAVLGRDVAGRILKEFPNGAVHRQHVIHAGYSPDFCF